MSQFITLTVHPRPTPHDTVFNLAVTVTTESFGTHDSTLYLREGYNIYEAVEECIGYYLESMPFHPMGAFVNEIKELLIDTGLMNEAQTRDIFADHYQWAAEEDEEELSL